MGLTVEWFDNPIFFIEDHDTAIGEHSVDGEIALVLDNGGGAAVLEGSFDDIETALTDALDEVRARRERAQSALVDNDQGA